jgi:hypothetical protein
MPLITDAELDKLTEGLEAAQQLCLFVLPKINYAESAFDADAFQALNRSSSKINYAYGAALALKRL